MIKHSLSFLLIFKTLFRSQGGRGDYHTHCIKRARQRRVVGHQVLRTDLTFV